MIPFLNQIRLAIAALNNLSQAQAQTAATAALNAYDPPTKAEMDSAVSPLATAAELAKVPKSDGSASWNATALAAIGAQVTANTKPPIVSLYGACDAGMSASKTSIVCAGLAGYGDSFFNTKYYLGVLRNANSAGNAPEFEWRLITAYTSTTGTFTTLAFSANVEASDAILVMHESLFHQKDSLVFYGKCDADMSGSTTSIVCKALAGFGDSFFAVKFWMKVVKNANSAGNAPEMELRQITAYTSATGTFTVTAFSANVEASDEVTILHDSLPYLKYQEYTSGSGNWTVPRGVTSVDVFIVGGGGSGGYGTNGGNYGPGGGGGEVVFLQKYKVTPGANIAYVVGAGGVAALTDPSGAGGLSSFDGIVAGGGMGGYGNAGAGGKGGSPVDGGNGSTADTDGIDGIFLGFMRIGGGGGGGGKVSTKGGAGGAGRNPGGSAHAGAYSGSGGGSFGAGAEGVTGDTVGTAAAANSGGGGSGGAAGSTTNRAGGNGGSGYIRILWR